MAASKRSVYSLILVAALVGVLAGKEQPAQVIVWPPSGQPVLRFSLGKFRESSSAGKQHNYTVDVMAENLWGKKISKADFSLYLFDKEKTRIGEGWISLADLPSAQVVKFQIFLQTSGTPVSTVL